MLAAGVAAAGRATSRCAGAGASSASPTSSARSPARRAPLLGRAGAILGSATLGVWLLEGSIFWLVAQALDARHLAPSRRLFLLVLAAFFSLVPAAPGYVGTFDAAVIFGLRALDVVGGQAVAYALLVRFVSSSRSRSSG